MSGSLVLIAVFFFLCGCCLGSFLGMLHYRIPRGLPWATLRGAPARSACPQCGHVLRWWELLPVASYLILRGRCHACGGAISPIYVVIECLSGFAVMALALFFSA